MLQARKSKLILLRAAVLFEPSRHYQKQLKATEASFNELSRIVAGMKTKWGDEKNKIQTLKVCGGLTSVTHLTNLPS